MNTLHRIRRCPDVGGFTLIEIMVVIAILGLLATLVAPNVIRAHDDAMVQKANADLRTIADAARMFRIQNHRPPTLAELCAPDAKGRPWLEGPPRDPWGHDYQIRVLDRGDFEVVSLGPDGSENTEDDISSRDRKDG
jgi:general secretion pathway protein G